jgi:hypothetical protein
MAGGLPATLGSACKDQPPCVSRRQAVQDGVALRVPAQGLDLLEEQSCRYILHLHGLIHPGCHDFLGVVELGATREAALIVVAGVEPRRAEASLEHSTVVTEEIHPHHHH